MARKSVAKRIPDDSQKENPVTSTVKTEKDKSAKLATFARPLEESQEVAGAVFIDGSESEKNDDMYGVEQDDPEDIDGAQRPDGRKRFRINEDGEARSVKPQDKGKGRARLDTLVRDIDRCFITPCEGLVADS